MTLRPTLSFFAVVLIESDRATINVAIGMDGQASAGGHQTTVKRLFKLVQVSGKADVSGQLERQENDAAHHQC